MNLAEHCARSVAEVYDIVDALHDGARRDDFCLIRRVDELCDILIGGFAQNFLHRSDLRNFSVFHDQNTVRKPDCFIQIMSDEDHGLVELALQCENFILHFPADQRIKRAQCLVHDDDFRIDRESAGNADPLLHSSGELMRVMLFIAFESRYFQHLPRFRLPFFTGNTADFQPV